MDPTTLERLDTVINDSSLTDDLKDSLKHFRALLIQDIVLFDDVLDLLSCLSRCLNSVSKENSDCVLELMFEYHNNTKYTPRTFLVTKEDLEEKKKQKQDKKDKIVKAISNYYKEKGE